MEEGMLLGYKVNAKGIKVCPDKVEAILSLPSLKCLKDVQKLSGKLASLNRFMSKSTEKSLPFFKTLKKCTKKSEFQWTTEAKAPFKQMKQLIAELPTLTAPMEKEELIIYLVAAKVAMSAVLMMEREAKQMTIYFVNRVLQVPKINYNPMEKLVLDLAHASKRLKRYFKEHTIIVVTDQPIKQGKGSVIVEEETSIWMTPIYEYFTEETLPEEKEMARAVWRKSRRYTIINGILYKKSYLEPWLRCVGPLQANYVVREIHEGSCSMHAGPRFVVYRPVLRNKQQKLTLMTSQWPFYKRGIDIAGPFSKGPGKAHRTMIKSSNGDTPLSLTYRTEAVIPVEIGSKQQSMKQEARKKMEKYYNSKVRNTSFKPGDLVYRNNNASHTKDSVKLSPKWEGPYEVTKALGKGAYKLKDRYGRPIS
nr:reverse transcriptase domain-containing protein [Tanacetum cinerariifolium]